MFRFVLRSAGRYNSDHQKRAAAAHFRSFEEAATAAAAAATAAGNPSVAASSCVGNGCRMKGSGGNASINRENIPSAAEFMHGGNGSGSTSGGIDNSYHRGLSNPTSSVSTIPMALNTPAPPQPFRFRVAEYSDERKRSFVRFSRKYRQSQQQHSGGQVRIS